VDGARDFLFAGARLTLDEDGELLRGDALERRKELAHHGRAPDEPAEGIALGRSGDRGALLGLEAEETVADRQLRAWRELHVDHTVGSQPGAVRASDVADADAVANARELDVGAAHARVLDDEVVRGMTTDGRGRPGDGERPPGRRSRDGDELGHRLATGGNDGIELCTPSNLAAHCPTTIRRVTAPGSISFPDPGPGTGCGT
jgi:hypothetical protein